jgi:hypothetical protein
MVGGQRLQPATGGARTQDGAPADARELGRLPIAPRGWRRAQGSMPQVATTVYFWYSRICYEVHASWQ